MTTQEQDDLEGQLKTAQALAEHNGQCFAEAEERLTIKNQEIAALRRALLLISTDQTTYATDFILVPKKPTEAMEQAAYEAAGSPTDWYGFTDMWEAALKLIPKPRCHAYTHIVKGGIYRDEGVSMGASNRRGELLQIYRSLDNGQLYHRDPENFIESMITLEPVKHDN